MRLTASSFVWRMALAGLVAAMALLSAGQDARADGLLRHTGWESGAKLIEGTHTATSHGLTTTTSEARAGNRAAVALLKPKDPRWWAGGYRSEFHGNDHVSSGERWYGISYFFPKDYNQGKNHAFNDRLIYQFTDSGAPVFSLHVDAARQQIFLRHKRSGGGWDYLGRWDFDTERWYDIVFHVKWTKDRTGVFEMYLGGERVARYEGRTLGSRGSTYSKWGIYGQPTRVLIDEFRIASGSNQLKAVSP
ncbi:MAG: heparin lyase I family protein [Dehalococcoidia bacterium]